MMPDQNGIYITKKQASVTAALLVVLSLLLFIAGYFWGKQSVIDGFTQRTSQESFNDQVDYLLTMQSFAAKNGTVLPAEITESLEQKEQNVEQLLQALPDALEEDDTQSHKVTPSEPKPVKKSEAQSRSQAIAQPIIKSETNRVQAHQDVTTTRSLTHGKHYAALAGFAKKPLAVQLVQRLKKRHIDVEIKTKISKSASGKSNKTWYQVVTPSYDNVTDVQTLIDKILMSEKIKRSDIKIV